MRHINLKSFFFLLILVVSFSCEKKAQTDLTTVSIIPKPVSVTATGSSFQISEQTGIFYKGASEELNKIGLFLADIIRPSTGYDIQVQSSDGPPKAGNFYFTLDGDATLLGDEGYELTITDGMVTLNAHQPAGIFRGVQTIRQLLPAQIEEREVQKITWTIATGNIVDYPVYAFRGSMLDVSRHFFSVDEVKRHIDLIAAYKMNILHLHLSDDQGWRIEIKSWPNLTEHGGSTEVGGGEGGFYTQEEYQELVQYAGDRYITVIPEIDMPGHTNAALASYAELNCDGNAPDLYTGTEVGFSTFCTDKEITYEFIDDVVGELASMTPGPYIHIGGDESHSTPLEDYIPFIERVQEIVNSYDKEMIGWDEIANAKLNSSSVAQIWAKAENGLKAVEQGSKVILSPADKIYLDMQYDSTTKYGLHWAAYIEVDSSYIWDPATLTPGISKEDILGIEAPLWSETLTNIKEVEYMIFPRLPGVAEVGWTPKTSRNWEDYKVRLGKQAPRFEAMDINYYPSEQIPWVSE